MNVNIFTLVSRNLGKGKSNILCLNNGRPSAYKFGYTPVATIVSKVNRDPDYKRLPPFPYTEKNYHAFRSLIDRTSKRFDDNTKVIVVDGPIAAGKTEFAKKLASDLDMFLVPEANMDTVYINSYNYDLRNLDDKLPPNLKSVDEKKFCKDPRKMNAAYYQLAMLELRTSMYIDALAHVLNTGQGVVMVRSFFSDMVFAEAMFKENHFRKDVYRGYYLQRTELYYELLRPHVQIYLDMPVPVVQERIKTRGLDWEVNGKALTPSYLYAIEEAYKKKYLPEIEKHAEMLIYDWTEGGDMELVMEDIERIDFDKHTSYDTKCADWRFQGEQALADVRMKYTNDDLKEELMNIFTLPLLDCPELYVTGDEEEIIENVILKSPGNSYVAGYNSEMGDSFLFKTKTQKAKYPYFGV